MKAKQAWRATGSFPSVESSKDDVVVGLQVVK